MVTAHPGYSGVIATHVLALVHLHGWEYFQALAKNQLMLVQSAVDPSGVVASGERPVAVNGGEYTFYQSKKQGNPVEIVYPKEGVPLVVSPTAITSFAPHPQAARLFTDFSFTREVQQVMADSEGLYTGHPDVKYPRRQAQAHRPQAPHRRARGAGEAERGDQEALRGVLRGLSGVAVPDVAPRRFEGLDRALPIWVAAALALVFLMILPLGWLAWMSVSGEDGFTVRHYEKVFADPALRKALWNTVVMAFWVGSPRWRWARRWPGSPRAPTFPSAASSAPWCSPPS
jgi:hypothetical protein